MTSTELARPVATSPSGTLRRLRRGAATALLGAVVLSAVACSAGSTPDAAASTTAAPTTTTAPATTDDGVRGGQGIDGAAADEGAADQGTGAEGGAGGEVDQEQVDTEEGGRGDVLPPDEGIVDDDDGGVDAGTDTGLGGAGGTGGSPYPAGPVIGGVPLDMSQPFDVGREWAIAANYGDFALVDRLSCANDARAVAQGQIHQASLAALRQTVVERFEPLDDHQGYLYWSVQKVQLNERVNGRIPMILEADGWKVCYYPQY